VLSKLNSAPQLLPPVVKKLPVKAHYGHYAKLLRQSAFFRNPVVWRKIGSNEHYLAWLDQQTCASCRIKTHPADLFCTYSLTPGAAVKPLYSAITLCVSCRNDSTLRSQTWLNQQRINCVSQWAWESLKQQLGYRSWREVPPADLRAWALKQSLGIYLPTAYRDLPPANEPSTP